MKLVPFQPADDAYATVEMDIVGIGKMSRDVVDPLKRTWERGVHMGEDSTNPEAVKRHRPQTAR